MGVVAVFVALCVMYCVVCCVLCVVCCVLCEVCCILRCCVRMRCVAVRKIGDIPASFNDAVKCASYERKHTTTRASLATTACHRSKRMRRFRGKKKRVENVTQVTRGFIGRIPS